MGVSEVTDKKSSSEALRRSECLIGLIRGISRSKLYVGR